MKDAISWFDVPTKDFDRALNFYSTILGTPLKIDTFMGTKLGFFPMEGTEGVGGDLVPPDPSNAPSATGTRIYLNCNGKLDEVLSRVEQAGGKIIRDKNDLGDQGFMAQILDTEGNQIGLHSYK